MKNYLFTSESVGEGHPDKLCDQISDGILDACLKDDPESHVACECFAATGMILAGGEITTKTYVDIPKIARDIARDIGYTKAEYGLDCDSMAVLNIIHSQSPDIAQGVKGDGLFKGEQGAGDQGLMFGFACSETAELMPAPIMIANKILLRAAELRKKGEIKWLRPDSKSQVTIEYEGYVPKRIDTVVVSHQHDDNIKYEELRDTVISEIIDPVLNETDLSAEGIKYFINPTGRFVIGGPFGDTGLTGRKIIVDTYGGMSRHGGGAFSGKDPSKVDRSAAYMARYVAKNLVASGVCSRCEVQFAYAIGVPFPVSVMIDTFGTALTEEKKIEKAVKQIFDLSPAGIIKTLDLKKPIYKKTASYGHFGRDIFLWEKTDKADEIKRAL